MGQTRHSLAVLGYFTASAVLLIFMYFFFTLVLVPRLPLLRPEQYSPAALEEIRLRHKLAAKERELRVSDRTAKLRRAIRDKWAENCAILKQARTNLSALRTQENSLSQTLRAQEEAISALPVATDFEGRSIYGDAWDAAPELKALLVHHPPPQASRAGSIYSFS
mmetsp:Transcript_2244/g.6942  ORF Transcript_2244/g.6942 Transcript_2244/m.6942 type:complete len:165 (+) Transcript_2244:161-655(+)